jgi:hypothetical protein
MKPILMLLAVLLLNTAYSQSACYISYNFHTENDTTTYSGLLLRNADGTGFLRVMYNDAASGQSRVVKMDIEENYLPGKNGMEDTSRAVIKTSNLLTVTGDGNPRFLPPFILLTPDKKTGFFEPSFIYTSEENPATTSTTVFIFRYLDDKEFTKNFAAPFFPDTEDAFFVNYFRAKTRGGFTLAPNEKKVRIHLLIVADTKDSSAGFAAIHGMRKIRETFDSIRSYMGLPKESLVFDSVIGNTKTYTIKKVQDAIARLKPNPNDIVIFYYFGHGFRTNETDSFPQLKLRTGPMSFRDIGSNSLRINEDVYQKIKSKGARFNLVISDCCNSDIERRMGVGPPPPKIRGEKWEMNAVNVRALFLNKNPLSILVAAAKNGEKATCNLEYGGYFSHSLITALKQHTTKEKSNVNWEQVVQGTVTGTASIARRKCCSDCCDFKTCATPVVRCVQTSISSVNYGR